MTDIQSRLLSLLLEIDEICRENGIEYYIDGGTALGAIRHRGFLPWDDDADIVFTRDNYEKFVRYVENHPRPDRVIAGLKYNADYTMVYSRYCDTSTTCILRTSMLDQFESGLFIDLFVMDPIPDTAESCREYFEVLGGYAEYLNPFYYDAVVGANEWYDKFSELGAREGREAVTALVEKKLFSNPDVDGMTYGFRYDIGHFIYPRAVMGRPRYVPFENVMLPVAERAEDYLRIHYGDNWFMIPPLGEEETHNVAIDLEVPYRAFAQSYMPQIDRKKAFDTYEKLHKLRIEQYRQTFAIDSHNYMLTARLYAAVLEKRLEKRGATLMGLVRERRYDEVRTILANYYDMQLNRWFLRNGIFVPLSDDSLCAALYLLLTEGRYSAADKILRLRRREKLSDSLLEVDRIIGGIRDLCRAFERENYAEALALAESFRERYPDIPDFYGGMLLARGGMAERSGGENAAAVLREICDAPESVSALPRVRALAARLMLCFGPMQERDAAREELLTLRRECRDGILLLTIDDFLKEKGIVNE